MTTEPMSIARSLLLLLALLVLAASAVTASSALHARAMAACPPASLTDGSFTPHSLHQPDAHRPDAAAQSCNAQHRDHMPIPSPQAADEYCAAWCGMSLLPASFQPVQSPSPTGFGIRPIARQEPDRDLPPPLRPPRR